ncbi:MAG: hypothetical protein IKY52_08005, partial [Clostridia bacterium]|nr:hypothetical protein [Clostridia bacterium]
NEVPAENTAAKLDEIRVNCERVATTPHLLCMNGCDHQPAQIDIGQILEKAGETYPHTLVHSNFRDYFDAIKPYKDRFGIFVGELDGEYSNGWSTLANTASARIYLKQWNAQCENLLEKKAEPMAAAARLYAGRETDRDYFHFAWKQLLQNHPHDSICGCSVDDVHTEMVTRFKKVHAAGEQLLKSYTETVAASLHTADLEGLKTITVWNPLARMNSEWTEAIVDFPKDTDLTADMLAVYDGSVRLPAVVEDMGVCFDYILPEDKFRVPYFIRRFRISFRAVDVPAAGHKTFVLRTDAAVEAETDLHWNSRRMMNKYLTVQIQKDGSVKVTDKRSKSTYVTGILEDTGDVGDEYIYRETADHLRISTEGKTAKVELVEANAAAVTFKVTHTMSIPADVDRAAGNRIGETTQIVEMYYTLHSGAERLDAKAVMHNNAKNHRITVLTRNDIHTDMLLAEGQFDIVRRPITPWEGWTNPTKPGKMTTFFGLEDGGRGLLIAGRGLQEYEVLRDGANTMSLTLHRGVDQLGDWGVFPTPDAQCLGELTVEFSLIPYKSRARVQAVDTAYSFAAGSLYAVSGDMQNGSVPAEDSLITLECRECVLSAVKTCETRDNVICRVFQPYEKDTKMVIAAGERYKEAWLVDLNEDRIARIPLRSGNFHIPVAAKKIVTVELVPAK